MSSELNLEPDRGLFRQRLEVVPGPFRPAHAERAEPYGRYALRAVDLIDLGVVAVVRDHHGFHRGSMPLVLPQGKEAER
jgi:hypothetical protein